MEGKELLLQFNEETGLWEEYKEPYGVVECQTKEDYEYVKKAVKHYNKHGKWIPVSEKLPERFEGVLLWCVSNKDAFIGFKNGCGEWCIPGFETGINFRITHWMPLPEAPEESDRKENNNDL